MANVADVSTTSAVVLTWVGGLPGRQPTLPRASRTETRARERSSSHPWATRTLSLGLAAIAVGYVSHIESQDASAMKRRNSQMFHT